MTNESLKLYVTTVRVRVRVRLRVKVRVRVRVLVAQQRTLSGSEAAMGSRSSDSKPEAHPEAHPEAATTTKMAPPWQAMPAGALSL